MEYTIAGLGNPGDEYAHSRHNAGRMVVDALREKYDAPEWNRDKKSQALISRSAIGDTPVLLLCPDNYMNRSGVSVAYFVKSPQAAQRLIVIYDDMDLPVGEVRISYNRGSGGHRGVESIITTLKTREFVRVRIGVTPTTILGKLKKPSSRDQKKTHTFLLKPLSGKNQRAFQKGMTQATAAVEKIITDGFTAAMNEYN